MTFTTVRWRPVHQATMSETRITALLTTILALGVGIRLAHFWFVTDTAFPSIPLIHSQSDMHAFWQWAQTIVAGDWIGRDTYHPHFDWMKKIQSTEQWELAWGGKEVYHQAPFYPYFLALILSFANTPSSPLLAQLILGSVQPLILFFLARRLFDARVGLVAGALTAFYGPFIFYQTTLLRDWLPPIVEPLILLLLLRAQNEQKTVDWLMAGIVMGVGILIKETTLAVSGMALVWLVLEYRHAWRRLSRPLALLCIGLLVPLIPLFARNVSVGAPPFAISGQGPGNVLIGFAGDSWPAGFSIVSDRAREVYEQAGGRLLSIMVETLKVYYKDNPSDLLLHEFNKLRAIVDPFEIWNNTSYYYGVDISPALTITLGYGVIFPLGLAGVVLLLPTWRRVGLFYCYLFAAVTVQMITIVLGRFRLGLVPILILGAAFFLVTLVSTVRSGRIGQAGALVALVLLLSIVQQVLVPITPGEVRMRTHEYLLASHVYAGHKRFDLALSEINRARRNAERVILGVVEAHIRLDWATHLLRSGDKKAARQQVELADRVYTKAGVSSGRSLYDLGIMYARLGEIDIAKVFFQEYLDRYSNGPRADKIRDLLSNWPSSSQPSIFQ